MVKMADFGVALLVSSCGVQIVRLGIHSSRALKSAHFDHPHFVEDNANKEMGNA